MENDINRLSLKFKNILMEQNEEESIIERILNK